MTSRFKLYVVCTMFSLLLAGALIVAQMSRDVSPSSLVIHNDGSKPFTVNFLSDKPNAVDNPGETVSVSPIEYGNWISEIKFADGKTL